MAKMTKTERLQIRIDPETKAEATALFGAMGMTVTDAVSLFIHQSLISKGLPFNVDLSRKSTNFVNSSRVK